MAKTKIQHLCIICESKADLHHVRSKGAGGKDDKHNLMPLCRSHHIEVHKKGLYTFSQSHDSVLDWLKSNEWSQDLIAPGVIKWRRSIL